MEIKAILTDDDAVSPVIGVILMVAITVILAAVIGAFVLGFGGGGPSAPSVQWESTDGGAGAGSWYVAFEHNGGDTIDNPDAVLSIQGSSISSHSADSSPLNTGVAYNSSLGSSPSGEYTLVWTPEDGDSSQELATHNA